MALIHQDRTAQRYYGGVVWTDHALERLAQRRVSQAQALATLTRPQRSRYAANKHAWIYNRTFGNQAIEVVATRNEKQEWVVISVWSREAQRLGRGYYVRNPLIDRLLDKVEQFFARKRHG